jgi:hypothetical protein
MPLNEKDPTEVESLSSAQDWIRTSTSLRTLRPEHSASTNFATWAGVFIQDGKCKGKNRNGKIKKQITAYSFR